jgi:uncharacterized membrane protein
VLAGAFEQAASMARPASPMKTLRIVRFPRRFDERLPEWRNTGRRNVHVTAPAVEFGARAAPADKCFARRPLNLSRFRALCGPGISLGEIKAMATAHSLGQELHETEERLLGELRAKRRELRESGKVEKPADQLTVGQKVADKVASTMGSWPFIIVQSGILLVWIMLNVTAFVEKWDPYPFILLNLALSFQAAYAAPFIMMSQNRQQDIDRKEAETDHQINVKAELEIELLHEKVDALRQKEVLMLTQAIADLTDLLKSQNSATTVKA